MPIPTTPMKSSIFASSGIILLSAVLAGCQGSSPSVAPGFTADVHGGPFREDWAYASAELLEKASDGAIEKYTWSQWVWLRRP